MSPYLILLIIITGALILLFYISDVDKGFKLPINELDTRYLSLFTPDQLKQSVISNMTDNELIDDKTNNKVVNEANNKENNEANNEANNRNVNTTIENTGFEHMKKNRVVLCGLIRDKEDRVVDAVTKMVLLGNYFIDYRILIVENDSKDNTRQLLLQYSKNNNKIIILGCGYNEDSCSINSALSTSKLPDMKRITKMATLRNLYLDYIRKHYMDYDYMMVIDMDIEGSLYIDGVANSFGHMSLNKDIEAVGANGLISYQYGLRYYDTLAYTDLGGPLEWNSLNYKKYLDSAAITLKPYSHGEPMKRVLSCFGGAAIYKIDKITRDTNYDYSKNKYSCEHGYFNRHFQMYLNPSMIYFLLNH